MLGLLSREVASKPVQRRGLETHALQTIAAPLQWVAFRVFLDTAFSPIWGHSLHQQIVSNGQTLHRTD